MNYLNAILVSCCSNSLFIVFAIAFAGFMIGNIKIKGVGLGAAGVFLAALRLTMSMVQNMGLLCFVTSVGFIAGPNFFCNLKRNAKSYVCLAFVVIGIGSIICIAVISLTNIDSAMTVGILSGALTTTPGFAAAQDVVRANEVLLNEVTVGYAIGYPFGVVGVVLFVQLIPKILRVNLVEERAKLIVNSAKEKEKKKEIHRNRLSRSMRVYPCYYLWHSSWENLHSTSGRCHLLTR